MVNLLTSLVSFSLLVDCAVAHFAGGEKVTEEAILTFSVEDYQGSGEEKNVSIHIGLFGEIAPMSVLNFVGLCKGQAKQGKFLHYVGTPLHRIVPDFVLQMGDVLNRDGTGGYSIFGPTYDDEEFHMSHVSKGFMGMANTGKNTNGSQFYITLAKARWLDRSHVVFGKVIKGLDVVAEIGEIPASKATAHPMKNIKISACQIVDIDRKWVMTEEQLFSDEDIKV